MAAQGNYRGGGRRRPGRGRIGHGAARVLPRDDLPHGEQRRTGGTENPAANNASASTDRPNHPVDAPPLDPLPPPAGMSVRQYPPELIMEGVWLPSCRGRMTIEFVAELPDLSTEIFEA